MADEIKSPVFIIGTGRCGTTLFLRAFAPHPDFAWFSNYHHRFPGKHFPGRLARIHDFAPFKGWDMYGLKGIPKPVETYRMLNYCTDFLFTKNRLVEAGEVTETIKRHYRSVVTSLLCTQGKPRYIQKHTGFARVRFLRAVFPDALFIHVYRDGRAVAASLKSVPWWKGDLSSWWWGKMKPEYEQEYRESGKEPIVLAGIVWKTLMDLIEEECSELTAENLLRIRYDRMVENLPDTVNKAALFCGLSKSSRFIGRIHAIKVSNRDEKWKQALSRREKNLLSSCLAGHLAGYGFSP